MNMRMSIAEYRDYLSKQPVARKPVQHEEDIHRACFDWVVIQQERHPVLKHLFHPANGGKRPRGEAGKLKAMGVRKGVPDFLLPRKTGSWQGLAAEIKAGKNGTTVEQDEWLGTLDAEGYLTGVCYSVEDFISIVERYLKGQ